MVALSRLSEAMRRVLHQREGLMLERGIGYWITEADELLPVPPRVTHAEMVRQIIDAASLDDEQREAFAMDPDAYTNPMNFVGGDAMRHAPLAPGSARGLPGVCPGSAANIPEQSPGLTGGRA